MAKVENMRPAFERIHHTAGFAHQISAARHHMFGRKVALNAAVNLHIGSPPFGADRIVQSHAIRPRCLGKADIALPRLAREGDDGQAGVASFERADDLLGGGQGKVDEIL
eukprot:gene2936-3859_t